MAESRGSLLAKSVQKYSGRAKEKVGKQNSNNKLQEKYVAFAFLHHGFLDFFLFLVQHINKMIL